MINSEGYVPGQLIELHVSVAVDSPEQVPPLASGTVLFLVFVSTPEPHVLLQLPLFQALHWQFTATSFKCSRHRTHQN